MEVECYEDYISNIKNNLNLKYNIAEVHDDVIEMVSGNDVEIIIDEEFRAGQKSPETREEIYSAMIVYGFLSYYDGTLRIPNKELMKEFEKALVMQILCFNLLLPKSHESCIIIL